MARKDLEALDMPKKRMDEEEADEMEMGEDEGSPEDVKEDNGELAGMSDDELVKELESRGWKCEKEGKPSGDMMDFMAE